MDEKHKVWPPEPTVKPPVEKKSDPANFGSRLVLFPAAFAGFLLFILTWAVLFYCMVKVEVAYQFQPLSKVTIIPIRVLEWVVLPNIIPGILYFCLRQRFVFWAYGFLIGSGMACILFACYLLTTVYNDAYGYNN